MMLSDPIADMLTRMRNALAVKQRQVVVPHSRLKQEIAELLAREGWVERVEKSDHDGHPALSIILKFDADDAPVIRKLIRVSKPGRRYYVKRSEIPTVLSDFGIAILSTSAGIMTNREARKRHLGGEVLCEIS